MDESPRDRRAELRKYVATWRSVMRLAPTNLDAASSLGVALCDAGLHDEAVRILSEVARAQPSNASALANLGWAMSRAGAHNSALRQLREAVRLDPRSANAYCHLGLTLREIGRFEEAVQALRNAVALSPQSSSAYLNLGLALRDLGDLRGACDVLLKGSALTSDLEIRRTLDELTAHGKLEIDGAPRMAPDNSGADKISGTLRAHPVATVLDMLDERRSSGTLMIAADRGGGLVRFAGGDISAAWSPATPLIGDVLLQQGALGSSDLERALSIQLASPTRSERIGSILARNDVVSPSALQVALGRQIDFALEEIVRWGEGSFSFHSDAIDRFTPIDDGAIEVRVETRPAVDRAARRR